MNKKDGIRSTEFKEKIYELMTGNWDTDACPVSESMVVEDEFAREKEVGKLYKEVFETKERLYERLGILEDKDVEIVLSNMFEIARILSYKMYDYGIYFSEEEKKQM